LHGAYFSFGWKTVLHFISQEFSAYNLLVKTHIVRDKILSLIEHRLKIPQDTIKISGFSVSGTRRF